MEEQVEQPVKRGRGRPKGSKSSYKATRTESMTGGGPRSVPPTAAKDDDFAHADPATMLSRQLSLISWQQQALRIKMFGGVKTGDQALADIRSGGKTTYPEDTKELLDLSNALTRCMEGMKKHSDLAAELASRMTAEDLLEAALQKIEGQSLPMLSYAIRRLRAKRESLAPVPGRERAAIGREDEDERATSAIASLMSDS